MTLLKRIERLETMRPVRDVDRIVVMTDNGRFVYRSRAEARRAHPELTCDNSIEIVVDDDREIAEEVGVAQKTVNGQVGDWAKIPDLEFLPNLPYEKDPDWSPPLYDVWTFAKRTNKV